MGKILSQFNFFHFFIRVHKIIPFLIIPFAYQNCISFQPFCIAFRDIINHSVCKTESPKKECNLSNMVKNNTTLITHPNMHYNTHNLLHTILKAHTNTTHNTHISKHITLYTHFNTYTHTTLVNIITNIFSNYMGNHIQRINTSQ